MNSVALKAYAGTVIRYGLMYLVAKLGFGALVGDAEIAQITDAVTALGLIAYGVWSKRKALSTPPVKAGLLIALMLIPAFLMTGCAVVSGKAGESRYTGFAFGEKASSAVAGLNITEIQKQKGNIIVDRGVGMDSAGTSGQADMGKIMGNLLLLGLQSQGVPVKAAANGTDRTDGTDGTDGTNTTDETDVEQAATVYSTEGYGGYPGAAGEGVYGRPSCGRCRAYHAAHPDVPIINTETADNRTAMWAALRRLGFSGTSVQLPLSVTATGYTEAAK